MTVSILQGLGRAVTRGGSSRGIIAMTAVTAGAAGLASAIPGSLKSIGNEAAFGDENADKYFLGSRGLSAGTVFDATGGLALTGTASAVGAGLGMVGGAALGGGIGSVATEMLKNTKIPTHFADNIPVLGRKSNTKKFVEIRNAFTKN